MFPFIFYSYLAAVMIVSLYIPWRPVGNPFGIWLCFILHSSLLNWPLVFNVLAGHYTAEEYQSVYLQETKVVKPIMLVLAVSFIPKIGSKFCTFDPTKHHD